MGCSNWMGWSSLSASLSCGCSWVTVSDGRCQNLHRSWIIVSCCQTRLVHDANGPVNLVRGARGVRSQLSHPREHLGCALRLLRAWRSPWIRCIECPDAVWHDLLNFLSSHGDKKENTGHLVEQPARRWYFQHGNVQPDLLTFMIVQDDVNWPMSGVAFLTSLICSGVTGEGPGQWTVSFS